MHWIPNTAGIRLPGSRTRSPWTTQVCGAAPNWFPRIDGGASIMVFDPRLNDRVPLNALLHHQGLAPVC